MIRAAMREKFGHGRKARKQAREWLAKALGLEHAAVHELNAEQCAKALEVLERLPCSFDNEKRGSHVHDAA
jgi:hypothetical protein